MAALAAEAAEESPRASMIAAPRFCTVGMNVLSIHAWSLIELRGVLAVHFGVEDVRILRRRVVAPDRSSSSPSVTGLPVFWRDLRERAVVVEPHHRA